MADSKRKDGTFSNDAVEPLYAPWEMPSKFRTRAEKDGAPALVVAGRRPSKRTVVNNLRDAVATWRADAYGGACDTTRTLLNYWFERSHRVSNGGEEIDFRYYFCQREAVETVIFLKEMWKSDRVSQILDEFGSENDKIAAYGISDEEDAWPKAAFKMATGSGKTKAMALLIAWSYFHAHFESDSPMAKHFVLIAPGLTVYERLRDDFSAGRIFDTDPIIPPEWKVDWNISVVEQDAAGGAGTGGVIYLTNIHRLYDLSKKKGSSAGNYAAFMGPAVNKATALDTAALLRDRIMAHKTIMVLNDEAHHVWDPDSAWNEAITALHNGCRSRGGAGVIHQLDFSATPKDDKGNLFRHVVCDTPLGEAVDGGIVKFPVIGKASKLSAGASEDAGYRYGMHLRLGYDRWKRSYDEWKPTGRKALMFVMCEDTKAADEITKRLNEDTENFPLLKGRTINLHTNLKGKIVWKGSGEDRVPVFVEKEADISDEDLKELRKLSRELDSGESPYLCIVSVLMLREGWDVKNVTTIVPLRQYSAESKILAEQTLGRGLRRMTGPGSPGGVIEKVTVIDHPAFSELYREELEQEGLFPETADPEEIEATTVDIFVDTKKDTAALAITLPALSAGYAIKPMLKPLTIEDVKQRFGDKEKLPLATKTDRIVDFEARSLTTNELLEKLRLDMPQMVNAVQAISYYVRLIEADCKVGKLHAAIAGLLQTFIEEIVFKEKVSLFDQRVTPRLADADVVSHVLYTFVPLIRERTVESKKRLDEGTPVSLAGWKLFKASHSGRNPCKQANKTMFNLVPCRGGLESVFVPFLDLVDNGVAAFAKNAGPQALRIDYVRVNGQVSTYSPDFFVRDSAGGMYLLETKGRVDTDVPRKARAAVTWCEAASKAGAPWKYVYVPDTATDAMATGSWATLVNVSAVTLEALLNQKQLEEQIPLFASVLAGEIKPKVPSFIDQATLSALPPQARKAADEALLMFDYLSKRPDPSFAPVFTGLLGVVDAAARALLASRLQTSVPSSPLDQAAWFDPGSSGKIPSEHYRRVAQNLRKTLLFNAGLMPIGLLRECLEYALNDSADYPGVFDTVRKAFRFQGARKLLAEVSAVYAFRNKYVAHQEAQLTDAQDAAKELGRWVSVLELIRAAAATP